MGNLNTKNTPQAGKDLVYAGLVALGKPIIIIASDHGGFELKEFLVRELGSDYAIENLGCPDTDSVDYPDYAHLLCTRLGDLQAQVSSPILGILVCGTGIGMCIAANKHKGIRAALCHDVFSAAATREHNDSNVLCLGGRVIGEGLALRIVRTWLTTAFSGEKRHELRIAKINDLEE